MLIDVKAVPNAKREVIKKEGAVYTVFLKEAPRDGHANDALIRIFAKYFNVRKSAVSISKGLKSKNKTLEILKNV